MKHPPTKSIKSSPTKAYRVFIGGFFDKSSQLKIEACQTLLKNTLGLHHQRWIATSNFHLTFCFFGMIDIESIALLGTRLQSLEVRKAYEIAITKLVAFPHQHQARVLALSCKEHPDLFETKMKIEELLKKLNLPFDQKSFHPHISLCRFKKPNQLSDQQLILNDAPKTLNINKICLINSLGSSKGPNYRSICEL